MPTISVNGETLGYNRAGAGEPLLLIHSLGTAAWLWAEQIRRWQDRFDVIAVDARGHGRSSRNGGFTVRNVASDCAAVLDALGVGPAKVIGISMGGPIAAHLTDVAPEKVSRLVIADSFATQGSAGAERAALIAKTIAEKGMEAYGRQLPRTRWSRTAIRLFRRRWPAQSRRWAPKPTWRPPTPSSPPTSSRS